MLGGMETTTVQTKYNTFKIKSQRLKDIFIGKCLSVKIFKGVSYRERA